MSAPYRTNVFISPHCAHPSRGARFLAWLLRQSVRVAYYRSEQRALISVVSRWTSEAHVFDCSGDDLAAVRDAAIRATEARRALEISGMASGQTIMIDWHLVPHLAHCAQAALSAPPTENGLATTHEAP